jgi:membrane fusion protein, heavy metal efflux system
MPDDVIVVRFTKRALAAGLVVAAAGMFVAAYLGWSPVGWSGSEATAGAGPSPPTKPPAQPVVELTRSQSAAIQVATVGERLFPREKEATGNIDFNQDRNVQVSPNYQGLILNLFAKVGDDVAQGQTLYTIQSPDLIQAESTLIAASGVLDLTTRALSRARQLYAVEGIAQKDLEQAVSDQQTAEGNLKAARDAVAVFGKTAEEIDTIVKTRRVDPVLAVRAPIGGRITARSAAPGDLAQPGATPAPYAMADLSTVWMLAYVPETDAALYRLGEEVKVSVFAYPSRVFEGRIATLGATVDPNTHRMMLRAAVDDPQHALRPNMFAAFTIATGPPVRAAAAPLEAVVREADGTQTVWVTTDKLHYTQRTVEIGMQRDGYRQIVKGLRPGELIAVKGSLLLDNLLNNAGSAS